LKATTLSKKITFPGDSVVDTFSQIYPGLRWTVENKIHHRTTPVHFVEYCAAIDKKEHLELSKSQHIRIGCDCLGRESIDISDNCTHSAMVNDNNFLLFISEVILKSHSKEIEIKGYEELFRHHPKNSDYCSNFFR